MKALRDHFLGQSAEKLPGFFVLIRGEKKGSEGLSEAAAEVENVQHNGIILVFLGGCN